MDRFKLQADELGRSTEALQTVLKETARKTNEEKRTAEQSSAAERAQLEATIVQQQRASAEELDRTRAMKLLHSRSS